MAYTDNEKIRDLEQYAKKHGFDRVIVIGFRTQKNMPQEFRLLSYGKNKKLCDEAKAMSSKLYKFIMSGGINA